MTGSATESYIAVVIQHRKREHFRLSAFDLACGKHHQVRRMPYTHSIARSLIIK